MDVLLYHTKTCHVWQTALKEVGDALIQAGIKANVKTVVVNTQEEAEKHRFLGSPTVHVNGKDVDSMAEKLTRYSLSSCRTYWWKGKSFEYPPKEMILSALKGQSNAR